MTIRLLPCQERQTADLFSATLEDLTNQEIFDSVGIVGRSFIGMSSSSRTFALILRSNGEASIGLSSSRLSTNPFELYPNEESAIHIPFRLSGRMDPVFPPPTPPIDFAGLSDPTTAPTLVKSVTEDGYLTPGTYQYSYAAWKGSRAQTTIPSPISVITLLTENTVTLTYPVITGADGYLVYREDL